MSGIHVKGHATTPGTLKLITSAIANIDWYLSYVKAVKATLVPSDADHVDGNIAAATTTTLLTGPNLATDIYASRAGWWRNKHASQACDLTWLLNNGTDRELHKDTLQPGEAMQLTENGFIKLAAASAGFGDVLERSLDADQAGANVATAQNWFPTTGAVAVEAGVTYDFEGLLDLVRAAGVTSHTLSLLFGGTATLTHILYKALITSTDLEANGNANETTSRSAAATVVKAASTSATEAFGLYVKGTVKINAAGTFIPQFQYSVAPGGAPTSKVGSFFRLTKKGASFNAKGTWT
jgi:hypothetical protein